MAVTAQDVDRAVGLAADALRRVPATAWDDPAGSLTWTRWETAEHLADDLFAYAVQLGPAPLAATTEVPFLAEARRPGGPGNSVHASRAAGPDGLLAVLAASGALLVAMVSTAPPSVRAHHVFGASDPTGFAAMGVVETLVHTHDITAGLGLHWAPPADLCARVLARLFPDAPAHASPWPTLLWATGRAELPDHPRRTTWRWHGTPVTTPVGMGAPVPVLRIHDERSAKEFYLDYLGFTTEWEHRFEPGLPLYTRLRRDHAVLDLSEHHGDGTPGLVVWLPVGDVHALHAELTHRGHPRVHPGVEPDSPGGPTMSITDPFGNGLRFCQPG